MEPAADRERENFVQYLQLDSVVVLATIVTQKITAKTMGKVRENVGQHSTESGKILRTFCFVALSLNECNRFYVSALITLRSRYHLSRASVASSCQERA